MGRPGGRLSPKNALSPLAHSQTAVNNVVFTRRALGLTPADPQSRGRKLFISRYATCQLRSPGLQRAVRVERGLSSLANTYTSFTLVNRPRQVMRPPGCLGFSSELPACRARDFRGTLLSEMRLRVENQLLIRHVFLCPASQEYGLLEAPYS